MENSIHSGGILQRNKKLETFLLVIGFGLFVFFGMRGLQKINNKAVAAGEAYKNAIVQSAAPQSTEESRAKLAESVQLKTDQSSVSSHHAANYKSSRPNDNEPGSSNGRQDIPARPATHGSKAKSDIKYTN